MAKEEIKDLQKRMVEQLGVQCQQKQQMKKSRE